MKTCLPKSLIALFISMSFPYAYAGNIEICDHQKVDTLIKGLESISWNPPTESGGEDSLWLIEQLGECRNPKAIPAMLTILGHAGGSSVTDAFAKIGPSVISPLSEITKVGNLNEKKAAVFYLGKLPERILHFGHSLSTQNKSDIKETLKKSIYDENYEVREWAVQAISNAITIYGEKEKIDFINLLEFVAHNDSYSVRRKVADKETTIYPVREKATAVLKHISK